MRILHTPRVAVALALSVAAAGAADAAAPQLRSRHEKWAVYVGDIEGKRVCYAATTPDDSAPLSMTHGDVAFMIATWRAGDAREQPMLSVGYALKAGAPSSARVGSDRFRMFTDGKDAFVERDQDEPRLVRAMERGSVMRVETVSQDGTSTSYEFSLSGVTAALRAVEAACGG